jgi:hypothetical protein
MGTVGEVAAATLALLEAQFEARAHTNPNPRRQHDDVVVVAAPPLVAIVTGCRTSKEPLGVSCPFLK